MEKKKFIIIALLIVFISLIWLILTPIFFSNAQADTDQTAAHRGFFAPSFDLITPQGVVHSLANYQGNPVLLFFWASHCSICKATMPGLETVYREFGPKGFEILAINTTNQDLLSAAQSYFQFQGYTFTLLLDQDGTVSNLYQVHAVPTSVLIDPEGKITDVIIGSGINEGFLRAYLNNFYTKGVE